MLLTVPYVIEWRDEIGAFAEAGWNLLTSERSGEWWGRLLPCSGPVMVVSDDETYVFIPSPECGC